MPSRRRFLASAATATSASLLHLSPAFAVGPPADDKKSDKRDDPGKYREGSLAAWAPEDLVRRAEWDADESVRTWEPEFSPVQVVTVHHSARRVGEDAAEEVRAIYELHARRLGWGDVGYHLLIDPDGVLYEGRHAGDGDDGDEEEDGEDGERVPVFAGRDDSDSRPLVVTGGHVRRHNPGNIGVCLLGDFTTAKPTADAVETLERTLARLCRVCELDPLATVRYANPEAGTQRTARTISGHRDWTATDCPGDTFAAELDRIRRRVAKPPQEERMPPQKERAKYSSRRS